MKSPFPGMDPYIEACSLWEDFHVHLIERIAEAIAAVLPEGYFAQAGTRTYVVLLESEGKTAAVAEAEGEVEPIQMRPFIAEEFQESFVEIYAQQEEQILVTCIEVLSPSNKRPNSEGWNEYLRKRQAMLLGRASLVEIDLLRGGQKLPMLDEWPESPYSLLVCRSDRAPYCRVWPASFRRRLPVLPIPLSFPDPAVSLDLQPLIDGIYTLFRYGKRIDYSRPLKPALNKTDAAWVRQQLEAHRSR